MNDQSRDNGKSSTYPQLSWFKVTRADLALEALRNFVRGFEFNCCVLQEVLECVSNKIDEVKRRTAKLMKK